MTGKKQREIVFLIGYPGAGKTTAQTNLSKQYPGYIIICADQIVKEFAASKGLTLDQVYSNHKRTIDKIYYRQISEAIEAGYDIIIEKTHLSRTYRAKALEIARESRNFKYKTTAIIIEAPEEETHLDRLVRRAFKEDRVVTLNYFALNPEFERPISDDGEFDQVISIGQPPKNPLMSSYFMEAASHDVTSLIR